MISKFFVPLVCVLVLVFCGSALAANCASCPPAIKYYKTEGGKTVAFQPDTEWPFIKYMRELEPKNHQFSHVWLDYDANNLLFIYVDLDAGAACLNGYSVHVADVSAMTGAQWEAVPTLYVLPLTCEDFLYLLDQQLAPE